mmetsp:Transcript_19391/g.53245  ORF Transcript_19391/g.53245 Transcript_19391/m.53245 type:complete len:444 (-) Transcript_19391:233-1564(-)
MPAIALVQGATWAVVLLLAVARSESSSRGARAAISAGADDDDDTASIGAIPSWKLGMRLDPSRLIRPQPQLPLSYGVHEIRGGVTGYSDGVYADGAYADYDPNSPDYGGGDTSVVYAPGSGGVAGNYYGGRTMIRTRSDSAFGGSEGQDEQVCPVINLPEYVLLDRVAATGPGRGQWLSSARATIVTWAQNFWSLSWATVYVTTLSGDMAVKAEPVTEQSLMDMYGWSANAANYPAVTALDSASKALAGLSPANEPETITFALTDCQSSLLFVVRSEKRPPGVMDVYDRNGNLIAHTLSHPVYERHQFIDPNGYLLAIAETPGLFQNVTRQAPLVPGQRREVLPYAMAFMKTGYPNASRLLDSDFRWVLAAAVQVKAIQNAYGTWAPKRGWAVLALLAGGVVLVVCLAVQAMRALRALVYPHTKRNPFMVPNKTFHGPATMYI